MELLSQRTTRLPFRNGPVVSSRSRRSSDGDQNITDLSPLRPLHPPHDIVCSSRAPSSEQRLATDDGTLWKHLIVPAPDSPQPSPSSHPCASTSCAVDKAFATTELLELILTFLETRDILTNQRTSSRWRELIGHSPSLRLHHFVYPQWSRSVAADFQLLDPKIKGLTIKRGAPIDKGCWIEVSMTAEAASFICPPERRRRSRSIFEGLRGGLGPRHVSHPDGGEDAWPRRRGRDARDGRAKYDELFITQPPIINMQAFLQSTAHSSNAQNDSSDHDGAGPDAKVNCDAGVTLGFLADTAISLFQAEKSSVSQAEKSSGNRDGAVLFKSIVGFCTAPRPTQKRSAIRHVTLLS